MRALFLPLFFVLMTGAVQAASIQYIRIESANPGTGLGWLQISEIDAFALGIDRATAADASATAASSGFLGDVNKPLLNESDMAIACFTTNCPELYISGSIGADQFYEVDLGAEYDIDSVKIWGRISIDIIALRDVWLVSFLDSTRAPIGPAVLADASDLVTHSATVAPIPVPGLAYLFIVSLATLHRIRYRRPAI